MSDQDKLEQYRKEARARGAVEISDETPGQGFDDSEPMQCLSPELEQQVQEFEDRIANLKVSSSSEELAAEYREGTIDSVRDGKLPFQSDIEQWHPGRILQMYEFLGKLQLIDPSFFLAEESYLCMRGIGLVVGGKAIYSGVSCQDRIMPEWTQLRFDRYGVAASERKRGWRACLLGLIYRGHVTQGDCDLIFGPAEQSARSRPWYRTLYSIRNQSCPECRKQICICKDRWDFLRSDSHQYRVPDEMKHGKRQVIERADTPLIWTP